MLRNIPIKATDKQLRLLQAINHTTFFFSTLEPFLMHLFLFSMQSATLARSRNSSSTLMSMAADVFGGLCYNTYGLVINAFKSLCQCCF